MTDRISVVFFGTPDIGLPSLEHFYNSELFEVKAVVTQPDKPSGRGQKLVPSPIKKFALEHDIQVFQPKVIRKEPEIIEGLKKGIDATPTIFINGQKYSDDFTYEKLTEALVKAGATPKKNKEK